MESLQASVHLGILLRIEFYLLLLSAHLHSGIHPMDDGVARSDHPEYKEDNSGDYHEPSELAVNAFEQLSELSFDHKFELNVYFSTKLVKFERFLTIG